MYAYAVAGMLPMDNMASVEVGLVDKVNIEDTQDEKDRRDKIAVGAVVMFFY